MKDNKLLHKPGVLSLLSSIVSIVAGLVFGYILLNIFNPAFANKGIGILCRRLCRQAIWPG